jgi:hypothetical protein
VLVETICPVQVPAFLPTSGEEGRDCAVFPSAAPLLAFLYFLR